MNNATFKPNHARGIALSEQPPEVRQEIESIMQTQRVLGKDYQQPSLQALLKENPAAAKFLDPFTFQLIVGIVQQVVDAAITQKGLAPAPAGTSKAGSMNRTYTLGPGRYEIFPSWSFWGETKVSLFNSGSLPTTILVGDLPPIQLEPGQSQDTSGRWAGFAFRVTNSNQSVGSEIQVTVQ